jgi:WD40 repeat protein
VRVSPLPCHGVALPFRGCPTTADARHTPNQVHGECANYGMLHGHKQAVLQLQWTFDSSNIWSCAADKSVMYWDADVCKRVKNCKVWSLWFRGFRV